MSPVGGGPPKDPGIINAGAEGERVIGFVIMGSIMGSIMGIPARFGLEPALGNDIMILLGGASTDGRAGWTCPNHPATVMGNWDTKSLSKQA
jgi:hypothetical protein